MIGALPAIIIALFLSLSSLMVVLFRVSPIISPEFALPFFFVSVFMIIGSLMTLALICTKVLWEHHSLRTTHFRGPKARSIMGSSVRQGAFIAGATCLIIFLFLLRILNWWIALLVYMVFVLVEMAMSR